MMDLIVVHRTYSAPADTLELAEVGGPSVYEKEPFS